ncbi:MULTISPECIES: response regulator [unclassified Carboxylicivirga]|uniref:response regulator n=1 Tax=Carboxylicivirga TaxID=1628153 RepID=UPI003D32CCA4
MTAQREYNVIIVDDSVEFTQGLKLFMEAFPHFKVLDVVHDGTDVIDHEMLHLCDIILMDVNMPLLNGIEAGRQVNFMYPDIKLVAITLNREQVFLEELVAAGFRGFVDKQSIVESLEEVLRTVVAQKYAFPRCMNVTKGSSSV